MAIDASLAKAVKDLQGGNEAGFSVIYEETNKYVYSKCRLIMKDEETSLDLMQETYIQAYRNISSLQDPDNIFAWLGAIAYRQGMKIYRKENEVLLDEEAAGMFEQIEDEDIEWNPELSSDQKETAAIIAEIIDELPPLQKAALTAFYYDEMKIDQIADMYDCSPNTIKSRLNYAKKYVKERVEEKEQKEGYKLHSVSGLPLLILLGLGGMLSGEKYTLSEAASSSVFKNICKSLGLSTTPATIENDMPASSASTVENVANTGEIAKSGAATFFTVKTGAIIGSSLAGVVAVGLGITLLNKPAPIEEVYPATSISAEVAPTSTSLSISLPEVETESEPVSIEDIAPQEEAEEAVPELETIEEVLPEPEISEEEPFPQPVIEEVVPEPQPAIEEVVSEPQSNEGAIAPEPEPEPAVEDISVPESANEEVTLQPSVDPVPAPSPQPIVEENPFDEDPFANSGDIEIGNLEIEDAD